MMDTRWSFGCFRLLFLYVFLLGSGLAYSQTEDQIIYLDSLERPTTEATADFVRVIVDFYGEKLDCKVNDFFVSGARKMTGAYSNKFSRSKTGPFLTYYESGMLQSQINYQNNEPFGRCYFWYENGSKRAECDYIKTNPAAPPVFRINQFWSRIGIQRVVNGKGHFTDEDVTSFSEGELKNGVKHGEWWGSDYKDNFTFVETFKKGELVSGISTDSLHQTHRYNKIFIEAEPKRGYEHFDRFFASELSRNKDWYAQNKGKTVGVSFTIKSDGKIIDLEVLGDDAEKTTEVIGQIFKNYGPWLPAQSRGVNSETYISTPITID